jgi:hypothetical protein
LAYRRACASYPPNTLRHQGRWMIALVLYDS